MEEKQLEFCNLCRTWYLSTDIHFCSGKQAQLLERIAVALERIANENDPTLGELLSRMEAAFKGN